MKIFLFLVILAISFNSNAQLSFFTDKIRYCAGESIWFSTCLSERNSAYGQDLVIYIALASREQVHNEYSIIYQTGACGYGYIKVPLNYSSGEYFLKGFVRLNDDKSILIGEEKIWINNDRKESLSRTSDELSANHRNELKLIVQRRKEVTVQMKEVFELGLVDAKDKLPVGFSIALVENYNGRKIEDFELPLPSSIIDSVFKKGNHPEMGISISGIVYNEKQLPVSNADISIVTSNGDLLRGRSDSSGRFYTDQLLHVDSTEIVVYAKNEKNEKLTVLVNPFSIFKESLEDKNYAESVRNKNPSNVNDTGGVNGKGKVLQNVTLLTKKKEVYRAGRALYDPVFATVINVKDIPMRHIYINIFDLLQGRVAGLVVSGPPGNETVSIRGGGSPLILIDGIKAEPVILQMLSPNDIDIIDVLKGPEAAIYGSNGGNGVIAIYTRQSSDYLDEEPLTGGKVRIKYPGFQRPKGFEISPTTCFMKTLYWNPLVTTDNEGKAFFSVAIPKKAGMYTMVIQAFSADGRKGYKEYPIKVE